MHKIVRSSYQELYSINFKYWKRVKYDMEFVVGSFLTGAKHKFSLGRLGPVPSLCLVYFQTYFTPTHTKDRTIKLHTHTSAVPFLQIR